MILLEFRVWDLRRMRRGLGAVVCAVCTCNFLCVSDVAGAGAAEAPPELVARANGLYESGRYDKAELLYRDAQKSLPESAEINFNLGNVAYKKGTYDEAEEYFQKVAESANASRELRKKALYNLGNCAFQTGEKLLDSNLQKALDSLKLSILRYHDVIAKDEYDRTRGGEDFKAHEDAKYNIEVARLRIKDILDKLKQQEEKRKEQQKKQEEFIKKLQEAIQKQEEIVKETDEAEQRKQKGEDVSSSTEDVKKEQADNKQKTNELSQELQQQLEAAKAQANQDDGSPPPVDENVQSASESLKDAEIEQGTALQHLDKESLPEAKSSEESALQNLQDALGKLTKPQQPQPQPDQPQQEEQKKDEQEQKQQGDQQKEQKDKQGEDQKKMSPEEAQEELAKLRRESSDKRKQKLEQIQRRYPNYRPTRREYEPVDKDW